MSEPSDAYVKDICDAAMRTVKMTHEERAMQIVDSYMQHCGIDKWPRNEYGVEEERLCTEIQLAFAAVEREARAPIRALADSDAFKYLQRYEQASEDGSVVIVSRQAIDEVVAAIRGLKDEDA